MRAGMFGGDRGQILNFVARINGAAAEIHIFKPDRMEAFVQAAQYFPYFAAEHEKRTRGLLDGAGLFQVAIQIPVAAIHGVGGPQAVQSEELKPQRERGRKAADGESTLRPAGAIHKFSRR